MEGGGVYSPIITGIDADNEPAVRGVPNTFTALVTNVNGYPVTYHWSATAGTLTDSTGASATWMAPDAIGTYPLTVSIEANDGAGNNFFESTTFQIFVDNDYTRWTTSVEVQFDPDPMPSGGALFAQLRNATTGAADIYSITDPALSPTQLTNGFATLTSPTMRADGQQIALAGKKASSEPRPSIYVLPGAGGDTSLAQVAALTSAGQPGLWAPRFARAGNWLFYNSDSTRVGSPRPWFRDGFNLLAPPEPVIQVNTFLVVSAFYQPAMSNDVDANGLPDSIVAPGYRFFGQSNQEGHGFHKFPTRPPQTTATVWLADPRGTEVDWSPDGQHIVYAKRNAISGERDIWIINAAAADTSAAVRVTFGPADDSHPRFTPDGTTIFFVSNRANYYGLNGIYNTERRGTNIWSVARFDRP